jgi:glycosyltransferase involved in cell wall biosynthesis
MHLSNSEKMAETISEHLISVGFDESLLYLTRGGIARYIVCLRTAMAPLENENFRVTPIAFRVPNFEYRQPIRMLKTFARENVWQPFFFSRDLKKKGCNVLHMPCWYGYSSPPGVRRVATMHDLHYLITPERFRAWTRLRSRRELRKLADCDRIISVSRSTADDAMRLLDIPARKIEVVPLGCSFTPAEPEEPVAFPLPERFFLFVSSLEPGKNLALLRETWLRAEAEGKPLPPLIVVGKRVERVETEGPPPSSWLYAGRLPDPQVVHLYRRAVAFLYPSKYEGFGLPVLEAMILGCPVVCSPHSSLPEVGGEAAIYAEQTPTSYLAALRCVLDEPDYREDRIEPGIAWAKTFTWEKTALQTLEIYRSLV